MVLVENQLERTDHGHLGQLLTYAAGLKAVTIVWISPRFTEEHRATLDWLNEITDENFNFFGVEVQLFQIDDSPVAPHFSVISKPNDWSKTVKQIGSGQLSRTRQLQLDFWTDPRVAPDEKPVFGDPRRCDVAPTLLERPPHTLSWFAVSPPVSAVRRAMVLAARRVDMLLHPSKRFLVQGGASPLSPGRLAGAPARPPEEAAQPAPRRRAGSERSPSVLEHGLRA